MKIKFTENDIKIVRIISQIAGGFALLVAMTMIFSFVQLKTVKPLDNPALLSIKDQYDKDPANSVLAEQVRAMDLIARKAYFSSRWQVETGSYLLIAGAVVFILCQRIISGNEKLNPVFSDSKENSSILRGRKRKYLVSAISIVFVAAVASSFLLRTDLPDTSGGSAEPRKEKISKEKASGPDKSNWPFFRGQDSRGLAGGTDYPLEWDGASGKNIGWKIEIPGRGKSSPVIWEDKLFITSASEGVGKVYCINKKSGEILWTGSASGIEGEPSGEPKTDAEAGLAVSTVATNGELVCAIFANGNLICFDMDGNKKWSKNIGNPESSYGYSSSLLIYKDLLLIQYDSNVKVSLLGLSLENGDQKWETLRQGRAAWSSPVLAYFNGSPEIIINGNPYVSSFDPLTGKSLWNVECMSGDVAPSVAVNNSMAFAVTDYAKLAAINPGAAAVIAWEDNSFTPDVSSPVATDEFLFLATGIGDVACYNAAKGDTLWTHYFQDPFYASPIVADEKVYLLDRSGLMHIIEAGKEFRIVSESPLGEAADCTPAFSDGSIYIRGMKNLYCISKN